ncbi:hypothetical protein HPO96_31025 [Kribbella sandramycini]|uniref:Uncharacterized protein n=1 Tax=Kribbella sandramycini TaxID=60450 RepID=A0A7Y4P2E1_9ACTN|nr:hypothetical protein [Kribbella sandramycini]MBB6566969.1 hypothetical protein [Kribbella sandramycini]NOL44691.1 hypothetical protein [Kribbella sandramycini]
MTDIPLAAYSALLHSDNVATVCRALNMYQVAAAYTQLSGGNPLEELADDTRQVALQILARPPAPGDTDVPAGFDHVSALNVLTTLAHPEDAAAITQATAPSTDPQIQALARLIHEKLT